MEENHGSEDERKFMDNWSVESSQVSENIVEGREKMEEDDDKDM